MLTLVSSLSNLVSFVPSNLHNGASIRDKLYKKKMCIDVMVPFLRSVLSFADRECSILCSCLELFWMNFVKFVRHGRPFEISFDR